MKIRYADSHGTPQMIVEAEDEKDREILSGFINFGNYNKDYKFCLHGYVHSCDYSKTTSFNFGYRKDDTKKWYQFWK